MYKKLNICCLLTLYALFSISQITGAADKKRPNVIYICASDLGKGLLSAYGQKHFTTPNIDALINNGVSFNFAYGGANSTYGRVSLLTGYHDGHKRKWRIPRGGNFMTSDTTYIFESENFINNDLPFPENDLYLPQVFGKAGYTTAQIGMLGWGNATNREQMTQNGWDYYYGYLDFVRSKGYYPPFLFEKGEIVLIDGNTRMDCGTSHSPETEFTYNERWNMEGKKTYAPDLFIKKALDFINISKDYPFFLMFSTQLPKGPVSIPAVHPDIADNDALTQIEKEYASMVKLLDDHVGMIISELRKLGLEENTIVVFASDNGHDIHYQQEGRISRPYRSLINGELFDNTYFKYYSEAAGDVFNGNAGMAGLKNSNLEGGINIPLVFYRKGNLAKRVSNEVVSHYDFLPTIADMLSIKLQSAKDGISLLPILTKGRKLSKNRYVVTSSSDGPTLVSNDGWKLRYFHKQRKYELYNIRNDRNERYDVILRFPEKAEQLKKLLLEECKGNIENGVIF